MYKVLQEPPQALVAAANEAGDGIPDPRGDWLPDLDERALRALRDVVVG